MSQNESIYMETSIKIPYQGEGRGFESRFPLQRIIIYFPALITDKLATVGKKAKDVRILLQQGLSIVHLIRGNKEGA